MASESNRSFLKYHTSIVLCNLHTIPPPPHYSHVAQNMLCWVYACRVLHMHRALLLLSIHLDYSPYPSKCNSSTTFSWKLPKTFLIQSGALMPCWNSLGQNPIIGLPNVILWFFIWLWWLPQTRALACSPPYLWYSVECLETDLALKNFLFNK